MAAGVGPFELAMLARALCEGSYDTSGFNAHALDLLIRSLVASDGPFQAVVAKAHPDPVPTQAFKWDMSRHVGMVTMAVYGWCKFATQLAIPPERWPRAICFRPAGVFAVLQGLVDDCCKNGPLRAMAATAMLAPLSSEPTQWSIFLPKGDDGGHYRVAAFRALLPQAELERLQAAARAAVHPEVPAEEIAALRECAEPLPDGRTVEDYLVGITPAPAPRRHAGAPRAWLADETLSGLMLACTLADYDGNTEEVRDHCRAAATLGTCRLADKLTEKMGMLVTVNLGLEIWARRNRCAVAVSPKLANVKLRMADAVADVLASKFDPSMQAILHDITKCLEAFYAPSPHSSPARPGRLTIDTASAAAAAAAAASATAAAMVVDDVPKMRRFQVAPGRFEGSAAPWKPYWQSPLPSEFVDV